MSRRKARFIAFQSLFERDFQEFKQNKLDSDAILQRNISEFARGNNAPHDGHVFFDLSGQLANQSALHAKTS